MWIIAPLLCGLIFGAGLLISGMVQPTKVLAFVHDAGWYRAHDVTTRFGTTALRIDRAARTVPIPARRPASRAASCGGCGCGASGARDRAARRAQRDRGGGAGGDQSAGDRVSQPVVGPAFCAGARNEPIGVGRRSMDSRGASLISGI